MRKYQNSQFILLILIGVEKLRGNFSLFSFFYMMAPLTETDCNAAARANLTTCLDCHMYCTLYMQPFLLTPTARLT